MSPDQRPTWIPAQPSGRIEKSQPPLEGQELAFRDDGGKFPIHLIPPESIMHLSRIFEYGAKKYSPENWRKGMKYSGMYSSAMRHLLAFWNGEDEDRESQLPHLAHAAWNCLALLWYLDNLTLELDDREEKI